jgi:hypothetical protein
MSVADVLHPNEHRAAPTQWKPVGVLTVSHALIDLCQGMVPALLLGVLRRMKSLKTISGLRSEDFWKKFDAGEFK